MQKFHKSHLFQIALVITVCLSACSNDTSSRSGIHPVPTVTIGKQEWMASNLDTEYYRNGDPVRHARTEEEWHDALSKGEGAWCHYDNKSGNGNSMGKLYNWYAVEDPRGLAPEGWHVPSDREWETLALQLGGRLVAGGALKSLDGWSRPNAGADNSSRFAALPAGSRNCLGGFFGKGRYAYFWTSSSAGRFDAWNRELSSTNSEIRRVKINKSLGFSVRCLKDRTEATN
ncbi:fibrobacter succinogenes major paralogous domain-containing protein [Prosthecochloris sp. HL-130-GSB]|jgi:uncharacterized protein (TIGR02145 family)|uniref:fibrobacter succinogenes major paralogous domain-containing protein n=1 Tax=Prosthecochloris sp. HL-130-GSB TaxID=1974213 RepID=UPI000A1C0E2B|nr:fibrobacter succinogenes major paralogous domain-containing protein [Prosthecochloris sp. HL-130-GSB]ARM30360.1 hypothetical protein B9H02_02235 [Prosthecochloris sp. HL-130-GSB]MBO8091987.1 fibrobacter succinogenes major paralogous domain-containing protein [Prosthecochloris sp.]